MKNIITYAVVTLTAAALMVGMLKGCKKSVKEVHTHVIIQKVWVPQPSIVIHDTPKLVTSIPKPAPKTSEPSKSYDTLRGQYMLLRDRYYTRNVFRDTLRYDSSQVVLSDSVEQNTIVGRSATFNFNYPVVTKTVTTTITLPERRQLFIGGSVATNFKMEALQVNVGLLYKNRGGALFGGGVGMDTKGEKYGSVSYYRKLSFRQISHK